MNVLQTIPINYDWLIVINLIVNMTICGISVCRLGKMKDVLWRVKIQYAGLAAISFSTALAPTFYQTWPTAPFVVFSSWICLMLILDGYQWGGERGVPPGALSKPTELRNADGSEL